MRTEVMGVLEVEEERWRLPWEERIARANARDLDAGIIGGEIFCSPEELSRQLKGSSIL
jgi:hypothetical protein